MWLFKTECRMLLELSEIEQIANRVVGVGGLIGGAFYCGVNNLGSDFAKTNAVIQPWPEQSSSGNSNDNLFSFDFSDRFFLFGTVLVRLLFALWVGISTYGLSWLVHVIKLRTDEVLKWFDWNRPGWQMSSPVYAHSVACFYWVQKPNYQKWFMSNGFAWIKQITMQFRADVKYKSVSV